MSGTPHPEDQLLDLAYGELDAASAATLQAHLDSCPACARKLADLRSVRRAMTVLESVPPSTQGVDSLLAYAQQSAARRKAPVARPSRAGRWLLVATALVTVSIAVVVATAPGRVTEQPPAMAASTRPVSFSSAKTAAPTPEPAADVEAESQPQPREEERLAVRERSEKKRSPAEVGFAQRDQIGGGFGALNATRSESPRPARRHVLPADALARNDAPAARGDLAEEPRASVPSAAVLAMPPSPPATMKAAVLAPSARAAEPDAEPLRLNALCHATPPSALSALSRAACGELLRKYPGTAFARSAKAILDALPDAGAPQPH